MNGGVGGGGSNRRRLYNPFGETQGWSNPALQGAISVPEKVMGLTCLLIACAIGGVALGAAGLNTDLASNSLLWFIAMFVLVFATQMLAGQPVLGMTLFLAFGVVTGIVIAPLLQALQQGGDQKIVYEALAATAAVTGGVTIYARTTSRDFSRMGGWLFGALIGVVVAMVVGLFIQSTAFQIFISAAACVLFSLFLLYDVQRVIMTRQGPPGSAIRMALSVYLDIFNLFLNLLMILMMTQGGGSSRR
ncbi:MAG: Bax inhibitor-1 family protein [Candidatus Dormibacteria bacterium]